MNMKKYLMLLITFILVGCSSNQSAIQQTVVVLQTVAVPQTVVVKQTIEVTQIIEVTRMIEVTPIPPTETQTPPGPATTIDDGTWFVGKDIAPGTYLTTVPAGSYNCYYARLRGFGGSVSDIITNNNVDAGKNAVITISKADAGFESVGCGTWQLKQ
jgi:hypothetical protein